MKPVMIVVLVDALGWTLAGRDPAFAPTLRERRPLATVLGFSSGALPTAFTGRPASEHGRWLMYARAGEPKKLVMLKGYGHYEIYEGEAFRQVMDATTAWYKQYIPAR